MIGLPAALDRGGAEPGVASRSPRRSPEVRRHELDAARSRDRLLDAALIEFSRKGYAGARVAEIAARAGMNKQLISYYFGGKQGLYATLSQRWQEAETRFATADQALEDLVAGYVEASLRYRGYSRMVVWEGLTLEETDADQSLQRDRMHAAVADLRRRQELGKLDSDLDPAFVLLALFAASGVGAVLPQVVRNITGLDPDSVEFTDRYAEQLRRIVRRLA